MRVSKATELLTPFRNLLEAAILDIASVGSA